MRDRSSSPIGQSSELIRFRTGREVIDHAIDLLNGHGFIFLLNRDMTNDTIGEDDVRVAHRKPKGRIVRIDSDVTTVDVIV